MKNGVYRTMSEAWREPAKVAEQLDFIHSHLLFLAECHTENQEGLSEAAHFVAEQASAWHECAESWLRRAQDKLP